VIRLVLGAQAFGLRCAALLAASSLTLASGQPAQNREMAVTIDDLPTVSRLPQSPEWADRVTRDLLSALRRHRVPAIGFVNEGKLHVDGALDARRVGLLQQWIDAGQDLGNHGYAHLDLHAVPAEQFTADIARGEPITNELLKKAGRRPRYFRHPFLHTGRSPEARATVQAFLDGRGLRVAPVSIDNYDYVFAAAFDRANQANDTAAVERLAAAYVDYMAAVTAFYEDQALKIVGRDIRQILLIHANALNARTFDELAGRFAARGYRFIPLERALEDSAYSSTDEYYGSAGVTWLHRWALTRKMPSSTFNGEPAVPDWVTKASGIQP
jgi:peptidoglycan/xylan/chitin deacetylase (PgdA/CDA1 family)